MAIPLLPRAFYPQARGRRGQQRRHDLPCPYSPSCGRGNVWADAKPLVKGPQQSHTPTGQEALVSGWEGPEWGGPRKAGAQT